MWLKSRLLGIAIYLFFNIPGLTYAAAPPLQATEEIVKTKDGCGMVIDNTTSSAPYVREAFAKLIWGGACVDGLAMGEAILSPGFKIPGQPGMLPVTGWVWYGRPFGPSETRWDNGSIQQTFGWETKSVSYNTLDSSSVVWSKTVAEATRVNDGETMVSAMVFEKPVVSVYPVNNSSAAKQYPCPESPAGCETLWSQHAGPVIERIKVFLAENEPKANERMAEVQLLVAEWQAKVGPAMVAQRETSAKRDAGVQYEAAARKAEWDKGCWDKINQGPSGFDFTSEGYTKRAAYLRNLFKGECAGHYYAADGLKEADRLMTQVPELQRKEDQNAEYEAEQNAQREEDMQETAELFGNLAGAVLGGSTSEERTDNLINVLTGNTGQVPAGDSGQIPTGNTGQLLSGGSGQRPQVTGFSLGPSIYDSTSDIEDASACISLERKDYSESTYRVAYTDYTVKNNCDYQVSLVVCFAVDAKFSTCAGRYPKEMPDTAENNELMGPGNLRTGGINEPDDPNQQVFIAACRQLYGTSNDPYDITIMKTFFDATQGMSFKCEKDKPPTYGGAQ